MIACIQQQHSKAGYSLVHLELLGLPPRAARAKFPWKTTWVNFLTPVASTVNTCARAASYIHTCAHVQLYIHTCMYNYKVSKQIHSFGFRINFVSNKFNLNSSAAHSHKKVKCVDSST